jgi:hypothetical protein
MFRNACSELGRLLIYEAMRDVLPTIDGVVDGPLGPAEVTFVDPTKPVKVHPCQSHCRSSAVPRVTPLAPPVPFSAMHHPLHDSHHRPSIESRAATASGHGQYLMP